MAGEGCRNTGPSADSAAVPFGVYFAWVLSVPVGHAPAVIWPGMSLAEMAPAVGQAIVGLFKYTTGSLPNAAGATEIGWLLLNFWGHRCEWLYELCKPFQESKCLAYNSKIVSFFLERKMFFKSCDIM